MALRPGQKESHHRGAAEGRGILLAKSLEELVLVNGDGRHDENGGSMPQSPVSVIWILAIAQFVVGCRGRRWAVLW